MLEKQRPVGISKGPLPSVYSSQWWWCNIFQWQRSVSSVPTHSSRPANSATAKTAWRKAATSWRLSADIGPAAFEGDFSHMVKPTCPPPTLEATQPPSYHRHSAYRVGRSIVDYFLRTPCRRHWGL
jgi:hypothetical protein